MARTVVHKKDRGAFIARIKGLMAGGASVKDADIEKAIEEETMDDVSVESGVSGMGEVHIHMGGGPGGGTNSSADDLPAPAAAVAPPAAPAPAAAAAAPVDPANEARLQGIETAIKQLAAALQKLMPVEEESSDPAAEGEMVDEAPPGLDPEKVKGAKDSAFYRETFTETAAVAEIIVPGVRPPTFDSALKPGKTIDALCKFRRTVLDLAYGQPATRGMIDDLTGGKTFDAKCVTCDKIRSMFRSVGLLRRNANNDTGLEQRLAGSGGAVRSPSNISTIEELNKRNRERHARKVTA